MEDWLSPERLERDAVYLGVLTAWGIKPLSRLEYPVRSWVLALFRNIALVIAHIARYAADGTRVEHLVLSRDAQLVERYRREFDGRRLGGETACLVRIEARYFGYPPCCAEEYIRTPNSPNDLPLTDQALLFHRACTGCMVTPQLIPLYQAALAEARRLCDRFSP
ncbi:MAG: hypothetical protein ACUVSF_09340 [Anaerolineae bacterium]